MRKLLLTAGAVLAIAAASQAAIMITTPDTSVVEGTASVAFDITVSGGDPVQGLNFAFQVGDGLGGPTITSVDILGGTIFTAANANPIGSETLTDRFYYGTTTLLAGNVPAEGTLAHVVLNTAGLTAGSWALNMYLDTEDGPLATDFAGVAADVTTGMLTITAVPEPAALALLGLGGLFIRRRRA